MKTIWILAVALVAGCAPVAPSAVPALAGTSWVAEDIGGGGIIDNARVTASFDNGRVSGRSGCNNYSGDFSQTGISLKIGAIAGTMMACPPALMDLERKYLTVLQAATSFDIDATGALVMRAHDGSSVSFRREK